MIKDDYEIQKIRDTAFCSGYNTAVSKYENKNADLEKEYTELKKSCDETQELLDKQIEATYKLDKENAELKAENQKWKDEWQEQVQKATDEGYARTLQTIQLTKAKEIIKIFLKYEICTLNIKDELADNIVKAKAFLNSEAEK